VCRYYFCQAEDAIRDFHVTGVQTCALPIYDALANLWTTLCLGAAPGSDLAARCDEIATGGPGSRDSSAAGNFLGEIPGQGRAATRDGAPEEAELRTAPAPGWSLYPSDDLCTPNRRVVAHASHYAVCP